MSYRLRRILVMAVAVGVGVPMLQASSVVTTGGFFYNYTGPVGYPILPGPTGPVMDPAYSAYDTFFGSFSGTPLLAPQWPYSGYEDPRFSGSGMASLSFANSGTVSFWNRVNGIYGINYNVLSITGAETPGVEMDPATHKSNPFLLATIGLQNGGWFGYEPAYDPGYGPLYAPSAFQLSMLAIPVPFIGSPAFPGPPPYHVWNDTLLLVPNFDGTARIYFQGSPWLSYASFNAGVTGSFEIWGRIGSLEPVELRNPSAGVTLDNGSAVPEPSTLLLAGLGLLNVLVFRRSAKR